MDPSDLEAQTMLREARAKAEHLISELLKQQAEVEANPPDLPTEQLQVGREAMQKAIDSARRMLASLEDAEKIAAIDTN